MRGNCCPGTPGGRWKESQFPLTLWRCYTNYGTTHLWTSEWHGHIAIPPLKDKKSDPERLWVWVTGQSSGCRACGRITTSQSWLRRSDEPLKSRQAVPHGEEMCPIPLHIPEAIQSFPLNMDMTARESGEGNLRIASELREFTLNWLNNMWNWEVAQKANL